MARLRFSNRLVCAVVACLIGPTIACGTSSHQSATQPSAVTTAPPQATFSKVSGYVDDPVFRPVAGAMVQAFQGTTATGAAVTTDDTGRFDLIGPFSLTITIHATKQGYRPAIVLVTGRGERADEGVASVLLAPDVVNAQIAAGSYALTITADSGCDTIPPDLRTVVYRTAVAPFSDTLAIATASDSFPGPTGFGIGITGPTAAFTIDGPALVKELPGATYLEFDGTGTAAIANSPATNVAFDVSGSYDYCVLTAPMPHDRWTTCNILPANQIVKHTVCHATGFVLSAPQSQTTGASRR